MNHVERGTMFGMAVGLGQIALNDQAAAVLHRRMTDEAQHRTGAGRFLAEPGVRVVGRGMGGVRPLLTSEVDFDIAVLAGGAGHRVGLCSGPVAGKIRSNFSLHGSRTAELV